MKNLEDISYFRINNNGMNYFEFLRLTKRRLKSNEDYLKFQKFQATWIIGNSLKTFDLKGKKILDLGSGFGGYSLELSRFSDKVYSIDLNISSHSFRGNFFQITGDCNNLPIKSGSMDIVFCSSLIEHVFNQERLIVEIKRVLKNQGICYISFPPFYSPVGGHQFKPFHLLGERCAIMLSKFVYGLNVRNYDTSFGNWGLYPTTIKKVLRLVKFNKLKIIDITTRFSPLNFAKIPIFNELLTWHVEFIVQKVE
jgi:SAM-dependent methyltransferase